MICSWCFEGFEDNTMKTRRRWICAEGMDKKAQFRCAILVVYGWQNRRDKNSLWLELLSLKNSILVPLLAMGDFNEVLCPRREKVEMGVW